MTLDQKQPLDPKLKSFLAILTGGFILLFSAYLNGFPIVYSDTSTYLASGFELEAPFDRPIMYGLFLRLSSLNGLSLWFTILSQASLISFLIFKLIRTALPKHKNTMVLFLGTIFFVSVLTSVSWTSSQLIADIFTPILILSLIVLTIGKSEGWIQVFIYFIFFLACTTHISHVSFSVLLILSILILRQIKFLKIKEHLKIRPLIICLSLSILSITTMGSALSKSKHAFLMGALVEHGIAKEYLDENCADSDFKFCEYKDSLPDKAWQFLWKKDSPFHKMGGWKGTKDEFNEIIFKTLTSRKYIGIHIRESVKATADQLTKFKIGVGNGPYVGETRLYKRILKYFNHEGQQYSASLQNENNLQLLKGYNYVLHSVVILSLIVLVFILRKIKKNNALFFSIIIVFLTSILINAWACGTLGNAINRLGTKVVWFIPLITLLGVISIWKKKENSENG